MRTKLIAGNWKMNGSLAANEALVQAIAAGLPAGACDVAVCPPALYLPQVQQLLAGQASVALGAQDVSAHESGAYTGDVSAAMLKEFGVRYAIVGHSERRQYQGETDAAVAVKAQRLLAAGITPIVCVGESLAEREANQTEAVVKRQLAAVTHLIGKCVSEIVVAYEPVWAIGTGKTATPEQAQAVHAALRAQLAARGYQVIGTATTDAGAEKISQALAAFEGCRGASLNVNDVAAVDALLDGIVFANIHGDRSLAHGWAACHDDQVAGLQT